MLSLKLFLILLSLIFLLIFLLVFLVFFLLLQLMGHISHCDLFLIFLMSLLLLLTSFLPSLLLLLLTFLLIPVVPSFPYFFYHFYYLSALPSFLFSSFGFSFISCPLSLSYSASLTTDTVHVVLSRPCHKLSSLQLRWCVLWRYPNRITAGTTTVRSVKHRDAIVQCIWSADSTPCPEALYFFSLISSVIKCVMHHIV